MSNKKYIRLDADNVGDSIELSLMNEDIKKSQETHFKIQESINSILEKLKTHSGTSILMRGCDDILLSINEKDFDVNFIEKIKREFKIESGFSLSIGIGNSIPIALQNLRIAKLSGKNKIVDNNNS